MAVDLQVVYPQESIQLNQVRLVRAGGVGGVPALHLTGQDFRSVDEVLVNDTPSPSVMVLSRTELVAQLPDLLARSQDVNSVIVLSRQFNVSARSLLRFRIGKVPGKVRGLQRLIQMFVKTLLQTPGSDIWNPGLGGGLLSIAGTTMGDDGQSILSAITIAVSNTARQVVGIQARDTRSPREERLLSATIESAYFDKQQGGYYVSLAIASQTGKSAITNLEI